MNCLSGVELSLPKVYRANKCNTSAITMHISGGWKKGGSGECLEIVLGGRIEFRLRNEKLIAGHEG